MSSCGDQESYETLTFSGPTMGTTYTVKITQPPADAEPNQIERAIENVLEDVNASMSTYREDSELSALNRATSTEWLSVSAELLEVIDAAQETSEFTQGAFDATVGPLVNLWGFGPDGRSAAIPNPRQLAEAMDQVGFTRLQTRSSPPAIRKEIGDLYIDLSAIAKGFGVDQVAELLESLGITSYLVEIGGDLRAKGHNARGEAWGIGIEQPVAGDRTLHRLIRIENMGMATSGDYRNFVEKAGQRYSHTIDPRNGQPIAHGLASVTVLDDTAMAADALATAFMVLGPEDGFMLARQAQIAAYFILRNEESFETKSTPEFDQFTKD